MTDEERTGAAGGGAAGGGADRGSPPVDPRFDPAFQRGFRGDVDVPDRSVTRRARRIAEPLRTEAGTAARDVFGREAIDREVPGREVQGREVPRREVAGREVPGRDALGRDASGREAFGRDAPALDRPAPDPTEDPAPAALRPEAPPLRGNPFFIAMLALGAAGSVLGYVALYWALATPMAGTDTSMNSYVLHQMVFYVSVPLLAALPTAALIALGLAAARWRGRPSAPDDDRP